MQGDIGTRVGDFRIESEIGRGGMGVVYLAEQESPRRKVALKILTPQLARDPSFRERFRRESEAAASIEHPNVVPIYAAGESDEQLYLAMRYVEGTDLGTLIAREGPLAPERAARICAQVAEALEAAHVRGVVHRDVKPGNVLVDANDHAYLSDFGLVRQTEIGTGITKTGQLTGTVDYVAPEQIRGERVDGRADIYSLGCVLFECLTGEPPFRRETEVATLYAHLESPTPHPGEGRPSIPPALDEVVTKATAKRPDDRFESAPEFAAAASGGGGSPVPRPHRRWVVGAAVAAVAITAASVIIVAANGEEAGGDGAENAPATIPLNSLVRIDPSTGAVIGAPIRVPISEGLDPAVEVGEGAVWVLSAQTLTQIDASNADLSVATTFPSSLTLAVDSLEAAFRTVWVGADPGIQRVDPIDGDALRPVRLDQGATVAVGGGRVWAATARGTLYRVDPASLSVEEEVETDANASDLAAGFGATWIVDGLATTVTRVDVETLEVATPIELAGVLTDIEAGAGAVWVVDGGGVVIKIDPGTLRTVDLIRVGSNPSDAAVGLDAVWVTNHGDGTISRIDPVTGDETDTIDVGAPVAAIAVDEREGILWVVISQEGSAG